MGAVAVAQRQPIDRRGAAIVLIARAAEGPGGPRGSAPALAEGGGPEFKFTTVSRSTYVAELDLSVSPGSQVMIRWRLWNDPAFEQFVELDIDTQRQFADVAYRDLRVRIVGARFYGLP